MEKNNVKAFNKAKIEKAVTMILEAVGEDTSREGLVDTPKRVAKMYEEVFSGIHQDPSEPFSVTFTENHEDFVIVRDIPFFSVCEHHLVPFFGKAHVAYIPKDGYVVGLSKLARSVDIVAKRPQLQERMTSLIANAMMEKLNPAGVMIILEAEHMCMSMRGIKKPGSITTTTATRGVFKNNISLKSEILSLVRS